MARRSSNGLPYLLERPENGKFSYVRAMQPPIAERVTGDIIVSWRLGPIRLTGRAVIKVALSTSELHLATHRWSEVHSQVEKLIAAAFAQIKTLQNLKSQNTMPSAIDMEVQSTLVGQVRHDILHANDLDLIGMKGQGPVNDPHWRQERKQQLKDGLARNASYGIADIDIVVQKPVHVPGQIGMRLDPIDYLPGPITSRLDENNIRLSGQERKLAVMAVMRAELGALNDLDAREQGQVVLTPDRPEVLAPKTPKLSVFFETYLARKKPDPRAEADMRNYMQRFIAIVGDLLVCNVKGKHVRLFRDILELFPRNYPHELRGAHHDKIIKWGNDHPEKPKLNSRTINTKALGPLSQMFNLAIDEELIETNPCVRSRLKIDKSKRKKVRQFSTEELQRFLASPLMLPYPRKIPRAGCGEAAFWLPLLSLFTGARREELGQLRAVDIGIEEGIDMINIRTMLDEDEIDENGDEIPARKLKTASSTRIVPIHDTLKEIGFLDFVAKRRAEGGVLLFPLLKAYRGILTKNWGRWWSRYQDKYVTDDKTKVFHSFRHSFIRRLRNLGASKEHVKALIGHAPADTTDGYGAGYELQTHNATLQTLVYPGLDFSNLKWR